ncbi:MAG: hypothetical protein WCG91_03300 [Candidatus Shapirobacteria bacterium]
MELLKNLSRKQLIENFRENIKNPIGAFYVETPDIVVRKNNSFNSASNIKDLPPGLAPIIPNKKS